MAGDVWHIDTWIVASGLWSAMSLTAFVSALLILMERQTNQLGEADNFSKHRRDAIIASIALFLSLGIAALQKLPILPALDGQNFYVQLLFIAHACCELAFTYHLLRLLLSCLKLNGQLATRLPLLVVAGLMMLTLIAYVAQNLTPLAESSHYLCVARNLSLLISLMATMALCTWHPQWRLPSVNAAASWRWRWPTKGSRAAVILNWGLGGLALDNLISVGLLFVDQRPRPTIPPWQSLQLLSFTWVGTLAGTLFDLRQLFQSQRFGHFSEKITPQAVQRFLRRQMDDAHTLANRGKANSEWQNWAATLGLKTASFTIDHDPANLMHQELPASLMQIRAEEIQRCLQDILQQSHLHSQAVGHRIFGALDSETSLRPCIDTLKLFACLYLDVGPLVERRIKGLTALFPIIDPGLAQLLSQKDLVGLIQRNHWFMHLDFGWIDQHVVHSSRAARYDVRIDTLIDTMSGPIHQAMLEQLQRAGKATSYVWLSPEARDRLMQEAPSLHSILAPYPLAAIGGHGHDHLMFVTKFEQLIPRLQRHYDLDSLRQTLLDFAPSPESQRLHSLLRSQLGKSQKPGEILETLTALASFPWRGFREKDQALQLIITAYGQLEKLSLDKKTTEGMREALLAAVQSVGYPAQALHYAQVHKIALRDVQTLIPVAADPRHPRFQEAWLLLSTHDYGKMLPAQQQQLIEFIGHIGARPELRQERLVQIKAVDALAGLGRALSDTHPRDLIETLIQTFAWFATAEADADTCCLLMDAQAFISLQTGLGLQLPPTVLDDWNKHMQSFNHTLRQNPGLLTALMSRWQEMQHKLPAYEAAS